MKNLKMGALCVLFILYYSSSIAQQTLPINEPDYNKPKLFSDIPQKIFLNTQILEGLLNAEVGRTIAVPLTGAFTYQGAVISKSDALDAHAKSIVIKCTNRPGATFTLSRIKNRDGSFSYKGRIISFKNSDAFELLFEDGHYILLKKHLYEIFSE
jgi:hypothetical protein